MFLPNRLAGVLVLALLFSPLRADVRNCDCDLSKPIDLEKQRECSLCVEAEKQPPYVEIFFLKDKNPTKPNRLLALPRVHGTGGQPLSSLSPETRHLLWAAAITRAQETWGNDWGIAYNGDERRTQCHAHLHIGKLLPDQENDHYTVVDSAAAIPVPNGTGLWVHPVGGKLHVHLGEQVNETVLMR
jgi:CDP-diacylglycerol pyrophosphatase